MKKKERKKVNNTKKEREKINKYRERKKQKEE